MMIESETPEPDHPERFAVSIGTLRRGDESVEELDTVEPPLDSRMAWRKLLVSLDAPRMIGAPPGPVVNSILSVVELYEADTPADENALRTSSKVLAVVKGPS
jgi:hypothetical protein